MFGKIFASPPRNLVRSLSILHDASLANNKLKSGGLNNLLSGIKRGSSSALSEKEKGEALRSVDGLKALLLSRGSNALQQKMSKLNKVVSHIQKSNNNLSLNLEKKIINVSTELSSESRHAEILEAVNIYKLATGRKKGAL